MRSTLIVTLLVTGPVAILSAQATRPTDGLSARRQALEDREAIRTLWAEYGRTLDARDFAALEALSV